MFYRIGIGAMTVLSVVMMVLLSHLVIPLGHSYDYETMMVERLVRTFNITPDLAKSFTQVGRVSGFDPLFLATLCKTESNFQLTAISPAGYKGLMQTPTMSKIAKVDIMHGAEILRQKLTITNGNLFEALVLYKGGVTEDGKVIARGQAREVLDLYKQVKQGEEGSWQKTAVLSKVM